MKKPLRIMPSVITEDLQSIYDYHCQFSPEKARRILAEYDRIIALLEVNPLIFREREDSMRIYPFDSGTYLLYYTEFEAFWLVVAIFHASREPDWFLKQLNQRLEDI